MNPQIGRPSGLGAFGSADNIASFVTKGLVMWLDASDTSTLTLTGTRVDVWRDKLGSNLGVSTGFAGTGFNPTYGASFFNNKGGVRFLGNPARFLESPDSFTNMTWSSWTVLMAMQRNSATLFFMVSDSSRSIFGAGLCNRLGEGSATQSYQGFPLSQNLVVGAQYTGVSHFYIFEGERSSVATGGPTIGSGPFGKLQIGGILPGGAAGFDLAGAFFFNRELVPVELLKMTRWIERYYGFTGVTASTWNIVVDGNSITAGYVSTTVWATDAGIREANGSPGIIDYKNFAKAGIETPGMTLRGAETIDPWYQSDYPANKRMLIVSEIGNDLANLSQTDTGAYNNIKAYCQARKAAKNWPIILCTCLPRTAAGINANFETYRLSVNSQILSNAISEGWADAIADFGGDATIGATGASDDTTYYNTDKIHLNATGQGIAKTYITSAINTISGL